MFIFKLLSLPLSLLLSVSSAGVDMDYEGEIDLFTGEPVGTTQEEEADQSSDVVKVSDGVVYSYEQNLYTYTVADSSGLTVSSNVANRMITTGSVYLNVDSGLTSELYLDGEILEDADYSDLTLTGNYALVINGNDSQTQLLTFTIVPEKTGMISSYQLPDGFELVEVAFDDEEQQFNDKKIAKLKKDGSYLISYRCNSTGVEYALKVEIDHTPPTVELDGVEDGKAKGAVTVSGIEDGDTVAMTRDGSEYKLPTDGVLKMPGKYSLSVTDDAGNTVTDDFVIKFYLDRQGLWFGILAAAVIISAITYMVMARKKLRVR